MNEWRAGRKKQAPLQLSPPGVTDTPGLLSKGLGRAMEGGAQGTMGLSVSC